MSMPPLQTRQTLKMLGFTENESKILHSLFRHRKLTTTDISRETTLSFDSVHYSLHALERKGIVRRGTETGMDVVEVCSDTQFLEWIERQKERNESFYDDAKNAMQLFFTHVQESSWKPNIHYFEGRQGIVDIYDDMIATGKDIRGWTDIHKIQQTIGTHMDEFIERRIKNKILSYAIMPKNPVNLAYAEKNQLRDVKFSDNLPIAGEIRIFGDKVAVITFHNEKPVGFVFSGNVITSVFRGVFENAWTAL